MNPRPLLPNTQSYYTQDGRAMIYDPQTGQYSIGGTAGGNQYNPGSANPNDISALRQMMQTGQITPQQAFQMIQGNIKYPSDPGYASVTAYRSAINSLKSQLFAPMTINQQGRPADLNYDGSFSFHGSQNFVTNVGGAGSYTNTSIGGQPGNYNGNQTTPTTPPKIPPFTLPAVATKTQSVSPEAWSGFGNIQPSTSNFYNSDNSRNMADLSGIRSNPSSNYQYNGIY